MERVTLLAHGGVGGAIVESLVALTIAGLFLSIWLRERRARKGPPAEENED